MKLIEISNVFLNIKEKLILNDVSLKVDEGDIIALIGENGSGKSTLLDIILGDLKPTSKNSIVFLDSNKRIGVAYDSMMFFPMLKVKELFHYFSVIYKLKFKEVKNKFFKELGLDGIENSFMKDLSQGERKKIGLILAIIHNPNLLILDEPFANLDPTIKNKILKVLKIEGRTILFTTHDWSLASQITTKIAFIYKGQIINAIKSSKEILDSLPSLKMIIVEAKLKEILDLKLLKYYEHNDLLNIFYDEKSNLLDIVNKNTTRFSIQDSNLENAYLYLIKKL